jgi:hypothetical protein
VQNMETLGFLAVENIDNYDENELFYATKWLFSQPEEIKK